MKEIRFNLNYTCRKTGYFLSLYAINAIHFNTQFLAAHHQPSAGFLRLNMDCQPQRVGFAGEAQPEQSQALQQQGCHGDSEQHLRPQSKWTAEPLGDRNMDCSGFVDIKVV